MVFPTSYTPASGVFAMFIFASAKNKGGPAARRRAGPGKIFTKRDQFLAVAKLEPPLGLALDPAPIGSLAGD